MKLIYIHNLFNFRIYQSVYSYLPRNYKSKLMYFKLGLIKVAINSKLKNLLCRIRYLSTKKIIIFILIE